MTDGEGPVNHSTVPYDPPYAEGITKYFDCPWCKGRVPELATCGICYECEKKYTNDADYHALNRSFLEDFTAPFQVGGVEHRRECTYCSNNYYGGNGRIRCRRCSERFEAEKETVQAQKTENELPVHEIVNSSVTNHLDQLGKSVQMLQVKFLRRSIAMETMQKMLADPTKYSIYDLFQEAWGGGYLINLNFVEREEWK